MWPNHPQGTKFSSAAPQGKKLGVFVHSETLWEGVKRLHDAANQNYHEGFGVGGNSKQNAQGGANRSNKKVNGTKRVEQGRGIRLFLGSTNRAKSHSTGNQRWSAQDHMIIGKNVSNPPQK